MRATESFIVLLTRSDGHPVAVRNMSVIAVDQWQRWYAERQRGWVYDDIVVVVLPELEDLEYTTMLSDGPSKKKSWTMIPVRGPIEEVVMALNQGMHLWRPSEPEKS